MVDLTDIPQATALVNEKQSITVALDNLERGGRIVAMTIAPPQPEPQEGQPPMPLTPMMGAMVPTQSIEYPAQMITSIKAALSARRDAITKELAEMGVTGMDTQAKKGR